MERQTRESLGEHSRHMHRQGSATQLDGYRQQHSNTPSLEDIEGDEE